MDPQYITWPRDPVSSLTHLGAALMAAYVTLLFVRLTARQPAKRNPMLVFGLAMILLYTASGVYHAVPAARGDAVIAYYRRLDVSAIFLLIAGSFTPIIAILLNGRLRRGMLVLIWSLASVGIASRWLLTNVPHPITVCTFAAAGLPGFLPYRQYVRAIGVRPFTWALAGTACYAVGGILDVADWPNPLPGLVNAHELTHLLDMAGTAFHVGFVVRFLVPFEVPITAPTTDLVPALATNV